MKNKLCYSRKTKREISFKQLAWVDEHIRELIIPEGYTAVEYCNALRKEVTTTSPSFRVENDSVIETNVSSIGD